MAGDEALRGDAARVLRAWRIGRLVLIAYLLIATVGLLCVVVVTQRITWPESGIVVAGGWAVTALVDVTYRRAGRMLDRNHTPPPPEVRTSPRTARRGRVRPWPVRPRYSGGIAVSAWLGVILILGYLTEHRAHDLAARTPVTAVVDACESGGRGRPTCRGHWTVGDRTYYGIIPVRTWKQVGETVRAQYDPHHPTILADRAGTATLALLLAVLVTVATIVSLGCLFAREAYLRGVNRLAEGF